MLIAKASGVCGNPSDSGSRDNSQRMHQLSATDWFPQAVGSDDGCSLHTSDILDAYQSLSREGVRPFPEAGNGRHRRSFAVGAHGGYRRNLPQCARLCRPTAAGSTAPMRHWRQPLRMFILNQKRLLPAFPRKESSARSVRFYPG
jgi:hypothetical protein